MFLLSSNYPAFLVGISNPLISTMTMALLSILFTRILQWTNSIGEKRAQQVLLMVRLMSSLLKQIRGHLSLIHQTDSQLLIMTLSSRELFCRTLDVSNPIHGTSSWRAMLNNMAYISSAWQSSKRICQFALKKCLGYLFQVHDKMIWNVPYITS